VLILKQHRVMPVATKIVYVVEPTDPRRLGKNADLHILFSGEDSSRNELGACYSPVPGRYAFSTEVSDPPLLRAVQQSFGVIRRRFVRTDLVDIELDVLRSARRV
jgi:hypothetical protein